MLLLVRWTSPLNPVLISPQTPSIENKTKTTNFFGMSLHRAVTRKMGINRPTQGFSPLCPQPAAGKRLKATLEKHLVRKHKVLSSVFIFPTLFDILWYSYTGNRRRKDRKHIITYEKWYHRKILILITVATRIHLFFAILHSHWPYSRSIVVCVAVLYRRTNLVRTPTKTKAVIYPGFLSKKLLQFSTTE